MKVFRNVVIGLVMVWAIYALAIVAFAQAPVAPPLPTRDQPTIGDLKNQIADCAINAKSDNTYMLKLVDRIRELEKQVVDLRAASAKPAALPAEKTK